MFQGWFYLLSQIWFLLALATLLGLFSGWIIWGSSKRRAIPEAQVKVDTIQTESPDEGSRPEALSSPRGGKADDLKLIKGIGSEMEKLCNILGFYHFDQIASWDEQEIAWVDANLEGFKGRVTRDNWVKQAKLLAGN